MNSKHTPGPWRIAPKTTPGQFVTDYVIRDANDYVIATLHDRHEHNGPVIAKAPELFECLRVVVETTYDPEYPDEPFWMPGARALIAEIEGGSDA